MGIEEGHHRGGGYPPAADPGTDEAFLLAVAYNFDEARLLAVHLVHILHQPLLQLLCWGEKEKHTLSTVQGWEAMWVTEVFTLLG